MLLPLEDELGPASALRKARSPRRDAIGVEAAKAVIETIANQMPAVSTRASTERCLDPGQREGREARGVTPRTARPASTMLCGFGCEGPTRCDRHAEKRAKGLARPPVMKSNAVSCARSRRAGKGGRRRNAASAEAEREKDVEKRQQAINTEQERSQRELQPQRRDDDG